jgi:phycocyanobilin:ferredoxin oxidoreductase
VSEIWTQLINCKDNFISAFDEVATEIEEPGLSAFNQPENGWINRVWTNDYIRRAHIDVVDARDTKGIWMMHVCIFPQLHNDAPIFGFDVIAGKNKITGAFHDFSKSVNLDHPMTQQYFDSVEDFVPKKQRELPEWATNIFTDKMLAASNVKQEESADIIRIVEDNLRLYLNRITQYNHMCDTNECLKAQNYYCTNQQKNPHTPAVMKSLGLPPEEVDMFCKDMLFPKVQQ